MVVVLGEVIFCIWKELLLPGYRIDLNLLFSYVSILLKFDNNVRKEAVIAQDKWQNSFDESKYLE